MWICFVFIADFLRKLNVYLKYKCYHLVYFVLKQKEASYGMFKGKDQVGQVQSCDRSGSCGWRHKDILYQITEHCSVMGYTSSQIFDAIFKSETAGKALCIDADGWSPHLWGLFSDQFGAQPSRIRLCSYLAAPMRRGLQVQEEYDRGHKLMRDRNELWKTHSTRSSNEGQGRFQRLDPDGDSTYQGHERQFDNCTIALIRKIGGEYDKNMLEGGARIAGDGKGFSKCCRSFVDNRQWGSQGYRQGQDKLINRSEEDWWRLGWFFYNYFSNIMFYCES